jgi:hypothetical protein
MWHSSPENCAVDHAQHRYVAANSQRSQVKLSQGRHFINTSIPKEPRLNCVQLF